MQDLHVEPLDVKYLADYETWLAHRAATDILFKQSEHQELDGQGTQAWVGSIAGEAVAVAVFSLDEMHHGQLNFGVKPSERRQGIGAEMITRVLAYPIVNDSLNVQVVLEPENTSGQKIARRAGFVLTGYTPEGLLAFIRR